MKLFTWDELNCEIQESTQKEVDECNAEGGWEPVETCENGVRVVTNGRHFALDVEAENEAEAYAKFAAASEVFRSFMVDNED